MNAFAGGGANHASDSTGGIFQAIKRHVRYVFISKKTVEKFEEKMKLLRAKRVCVNAEVDAAERNLEKINAAVQFWCEQVDKTIYEERKVADLVDKAQAKCFMGLCPNIKSRYQLSRKAEEVAAVVDELLRHGEFGRVGFHDVLEGPISAAPKNFRDFDSRNVVFDEIMEALKDSTISMIGVHGPAGVGKTTLVNKVARFVKDTGLFFPVVDVTVTLNPNIKNIQERIAMSLGLELEGEDISVRAFKLSKRLENEKKILIVLDDLWAGSEVKKVGIPFGDQYNGCKILLTSRDRHVLTNEMDAKTIFAIHVLEKNEAWDLFKEEAENDFENSELKSVATEIANKCAELPLAILTVARALKNKDLPAWRDALRQLQSPPPRSFIPANTVCSAIQLSYDNLESEELKKTFWLCCLLVHNSHIEELLRFAMGLQLFEGVNTVQATRDRVLTTVSKLKDSCLLLDDYKNDRIAMHDFVRDAAIAIARDKHAFVLRHGDVFEEWLDEEKMENFKMICLSFDSVQKLPYELECPQLTLFSMAASSENSYWQMPTYFFVKMRKLRVLNLIKTDLSYSFPLTEFPKSLRTLCLKRCRLGDLVGRGILKNLQILSLSESNIEMLPEEIGQLSKLRLLDLTACSELRIIPSGVLSSLSSLEELYMGCIVFPWNQQGNASLHELKELPCLTTLDICIRDAEIVKENLFFEKLQRYKIVVGVEWYSFEEFEYSRTIKLCVTTSIDDFGDGFKCLLKKTEALYLENLRGVKIVLNEVSNRDCFLHLSHLEIKDALETQYIINDNDAVDKIVFRQLRSLRLGNLPELISFCSKYRWGGSTSVPQHELPLFSEQVTFPNLEELKVKQILRKIWHGQLQANVFSYLRVLELEGFHDTSPDFPNCFIQSLPNLEKLVVSDAALSGNEIDALALTSVNELKLSKLPQLTHLWKEKCNYSQATYKLRSLEVWDCGRLKNLVPSSMSFENLTTLEIAGCHGIVNLIAYSTAKSMMQLTQMSITDCEMIEEIIVGKGDDVEGDIYFTRLKHLKLSSLPSLTSFCLGKHNFEFPALEKVSVKGCPKMKIFTQGDLSTPMLQKVQYIGCEDEGCWEGNLNATIQWLFAEKVGYHGIKRLLLSDLSKWMEIWRNIEGTLSFKSLEILKFHDCSTLRCLFTLSIVLNLPQLYLLEVKNCIVMKHIILDEGADEEVNNKIVFPQLRYITLESCADLANFYQGSKILKFPLLIELKVIDCPKMFAFASMFSREQRTETIDDGGNMPRLSIDAVFFNNMVAFPQLEKLAIMGIENCRKIWHDQFIGDSFSKLYSLCVFSCERLIHIFPFNMSERLQNLVEFRLGCCDSIEKIFESQVFNTDELFAATTTQSIVEEGTTNFVFPKLTVVQFCWLPKLKSFYSGMHTTEWPSLKKMCLYGCGMIEIFAAGILSYGELTDQQPLFWVNEATFPNLEELELGWNNILRKIWHGQFQADVFSKLRVLNLGGFPDTSAIFPHYYIQSLSNLEKLVVRDAAFSQIFNLDGFGGNEIDANLALTSLSELRLAVLPQLTHLWKEEYNLDRAFCKLRSLEVLECGKLKTLVPSTVSFENLRSLEISKCHGFVNLIACSTAKSLVQLTRMSITDCDMLEEIIAGDAREGDKVKDSIVFTHLKYLELSCLPSLASFCLGKHNFEFPVLKKVTVIGCPQMKIFSQGDSRTPMLQKVQFIKSEDEGFWEGNLNTTIQWLFAQKVGNSGLEHLILSDSSKLMEIWRRNPQGISRFKSLKSLNVHDCSILRCLFTLSIAVDLAQLCKIKVKNCVVMEHVIIDGPNEEVENKIVFPLLTSITLESCANLASFYQGSKILECPFLKKLRVVDCPRMFAFVSIFSREQRTETIDDGGNIKRSADVINTAFFNNMVVCPNLEDLRLSSINIERIWHDQQPQMSCYVQNLKFLTVKGCHNLRFLFSSSMMLLLMQLRKIRIQDCKSVEIIFTGVAEVDTVSQILPKLIFLLIEDLPKVMRFCHGSYLEFPSLRILDIANCPTFKTFVSDYIVADETHCTRKNGKGKSSDIDFPPLFNEKVAFPQLELLFIRHMGNCRKIWHDEFVGDSFSTLNHLFIMDCYRLTNVFPFSMSERLQNLEVFRVESCDSLEEIFEPRVLHVDQLHAVTATQSFGKEATTNFVFPKLTYLELCWLSRLKSFYSRIHTIEWPSLQQMCLVACNMVEIFASERLSFGELTGQRPQPLFWVNEITSLTVSFKNLTTLEISRCQGFVKLIAYSTAQSLLQLIRLSISNCDMIKEIIADGGDEVKGGIVFTHLKYLQLSCLPSLASFCLGKHNFEFPALEKMIVSECPKMKIFCQGDLSTPQLQKVTLAENEDEIWRWEGSLNPTIQRLFEEMNVQDPEED